MSDSRDDFQWLLSECQRLRRKADRIILESRACRERLRATLAGVNPFLRRLQELHGHPLKPSQVLSQGPGEPGNGHGSEQAT
jgi:hypothetical protein